jgi:hypothetical protein
MRCVQGGQSGAGHKMLCRIADAIKMLALLARKLTGVH